MIRPCPGRGPFFRHIISGRSCWILRYTSAARVAIRISRFMLLSILYWRRYILLASRFLHRSKSFPFSLSVLHPVLFTTSTLFLSLSLSLFLYPSETLSLVVIVDNILAMLSTTRQQRPANPPGKTFLHRPCPTYSSNSIVITSHALSLRFLCASKSIT